MKNALAALTLLLLPPQDSSRTATVGPFSWPAGTVARVETEYVRGISDGTTTQQLALLRMTHRMRVSRHPEGLLVEFDDQKPVASSVTGISNVTGALAALLSWWVPKIIVSPDGHFLRIEDTEHVQELVERTYERLVSSTARTSSGLNDFLNIMASADGLRSMAQDDWDHLVGKWMSAPLDPDVVESTAVSTVARGVPLRSRLRQRMINRSPCIREDAVLECATFELQSSVDPESLPALQDYVSPSTPEGRQQIVSFDKVDRVTLEVGTMLPHEAILTRTMEGAVELDGRTVTIENVEQRRVRFTYVKEQ